MRPSSADTRPVPGVRIRLANDAPVRADRRLRPLLDDRGAAGPLQLRPAAGGRAGASSCAGPSSSSSRCGPAMPGRAIGLHAFVLQGMADNARAFARTPVRYLPYRRGRGRRRPRAARGAGGRRRCRRHRRRPGLLPAADGRRSGRPPRRPPRGRRRQRRSTRCAPSTGCSPTAFSYRAHLQKVAARGTSTTSRSPIRWPASACRRRPALDAVLARWREAPRGAADRRPRPRSRVCRSITASRRWRRGAAPRPAGPA